MARETWIDSALERACAQVYRNLPLFTHRCQNHSSVHGFYGSCDNDQWTCGFWPGEIALAYEYTGDASLLVISKLFVADFLHRIEQGIAVDHHDMGFLYIPSCVSFYKLTGDAMARKAALAAASRLASRFQPKGRFIQAWGAMDDPANHRFIIDCLLNLPLLYWASEETGNDRYRAIAVAHTETCLAHSFRPDGSTFHTFFMDPVTGDPVRGETCQGYRFDSFWARGQAWAIYGLALGYRYTQDERMVRMFRKALAFYCSRLPDDLVPYWDQIFLSGTESRDSSCAAIVACGLLEMANLVGKDEGEGYGDLARRMLKSLCSSYQVFDPTKSNGQLLHGTYSKHSPYNSCTEEGVDECVSWGDYFFMEALTRLQRKWTSYW